LLAGISFSSGGCAGDHQPEQDGGDAGVKQQAVHVFTSMNDNGSQYIPAANKVK